jgi:hypothetical protein
LAACEENTEETLISALFVAGENRLDVNVMRRVVEALAEWFSELQSSLNSLIGQ